MTIDIFKCSEFVILRYYYSTIKGHLTSHRSSLVTDTKRHFLADIQTIPSSHWGSNIWIRKRFEQSVIDIHRFKYLALWQFLKQTVDLNKKQKVVLYMIIYIRNKIYYKTELKFCVRQQFWYIEVLKFWNKQCVYMSTMNRRWFYLCIYVHYKIYDQTKFKFCVRQQLCYMQVLKQIKTFNKTFYAKL